MGRRVSGARPAATAGGASAGAGRERRSLLGHMATRTRSVPGRPSLSVVLVEGRITFGDGDELLKQIVDQVIEAGCLHVVVDTTKLEYMDSSGVDAVVRSYNKLAERGGKLRLVVGTERIRNLFEITKLHTVIETYATEEEALRGFGDRVPSAAGTPRG